MRNTTTAMLSLLAAFAMAVPSRPALGEPSIKELQQRELQKQDDYQKEIKKRVELFDKLKTYTLNAKQDLEKDGVKFESVRPAFTWSNSHLPNARDYRLETTANDSIGVIAAQGLGPISVVLSPAGFPYIAQVSISGSSGSGPDRCIYLVKIHIESKESYSEYECAEFLSGQSASRFNESLKARIQESLAKGF